MANRTRILRKVKSSVFKDLWQDSMNYYLPVEFTIYLDEEGNFIKIIKHSDNEEEGTTTHGNA